MTEHIIIIFFGLITVLHFGIALYVFDRMCSYHALQERFTRDLEHVRRMVSNQRLEQAGIAPRDA